MRRISKEEFLVHSRPIKRVGALPYMIENNIVYILFGHTRYAENPDILTDFGGGCRVGKREKPFNCLIREVDEESNGILTQVVSDGIIFGNPLIFEIFIERWKINGYELLVKVPNRDYAHGFSPSEEIFDFEWVALEDILNDDWMPITYYHEPIRDFIAELRRTQSLHEAKKYYDEAKSII